VPDSAIPRPLGNLEKGGGEREIRLSWGYCRLMGSIDTTEDRTTALSSAESITTTQAAPRLALA